MFAKDLTKCASAALVAAACILVMSPVGAAEVNDTAAIAYSDPVSLPCHPSIDRGACLKHAQRAGEGVASVVIAQGESLPMSAPCHPSTDRGACLKHSPGTNTGF